MPANLSTRAAIRAAAASFRAPAKALDLAGAGLVALVLVAMVFAQEALVSRLLGARARAWRGPSGT